MTVLAADLLAIRLAAEAAVLARLNAGAGDPRVPALAYLRDRDARLRLHHGTLRSDGSHRKPADDVARALAAALPGSSLLDGSPPSRVTLLANRLGLRRRDRTVLAIALVYELDLDSRELLHALAPRRRPALWAEAMLDVGAALGEACDLTNAAAMHDALAAGRPLQQGDALDTDGAGLATTITVAPHILRWLADDDSLRPTSAAIASMLAVDAALGVALPVATTDAVDSIVTRIARTPAQIMIRGPRGSGRRAVAHRLAHALGKPLLVIDVRRLLRAGPTPATTLAMLLADARLHGALPLLLDADVLQAEGGQLALAVESTLRAHADHLLLATVSTGALELDRPTYDVRLGRASLSEREDAWQATLAPHPIVDGDSLAAELAARYVLGPGAIADVVAAALNAAALAHAPLAATHFETAASSRLSLRLGAFGNVIARKARFAELVLPDDTINTLHDMVAMVGNRAQILERWDYQRHLGIARGVSALFSGDPGTGKTMAASVLASALGLELVRIDLAAVVSKFVGETEKNLAAIFDEAQDAHAMLLFDEADGLFAKRTEVKSAQDRFANLEVGYLLQRMESFDGVSVLTTNLESSIDAALLRRLNFRVRFPTPEPAERQRLWQQLVPPAATGGVALDITGLADDFAMSGGYIKNAIVRAAVIAARAGRLVTLDDLWSGAHAEYAEMGKVTSSLQRR